MTLSGLRHRPAVVVDCDPGIDDALALLFLARLHHRGLLRLEAVVTVAGNTDVACTRRNARFVLDRAGLGDVPVIGGAAGPLAPAPSPVDALAFHGPDALGGCFAPDTAPGLAPDMTPGVSQPQPAQASPGTGSPPAPGTAEAEAEAGVTRGPHALVEHLRQAAAAGEAVLLAVGPLTNVALALDLEPDLHRLTHRVVVMGGAFRLPGNITAGAEFNWYCDPDAADRVARSELPLEIVPLDVTERVTVGPESPAALGGDSAALLAGDLLRTSIDLHRAAGHLGGSQIHDALAAAILAEPDLVGFERLSVQVDTTGADRGRAVHRAAGRGRGAQVALEVDADGARDLILSVIGGTFPAR
ncbi:MAG: nucleoside hydrolase [Actinomycetota bacterium]